MPAYCGTSNSGTVVIGAAARSKVPVSPLTSRVLLKIFNPLDAEAIWYGGSTVDNTNGMPIPPGSDSDWIPFSDNIYVYSVSGCTVRYLEGA